MSWGIQWFLKQDIYTEIDAELSDLKQPHRGSNSSFQGLLAAWGEGRIAAEFPSHTSPPTRQAPFLLNPGALTSSVVYHPNGATAQDF